MNKFYVTKEIAEKLVSKGIYLESDYVLERNIIARRYEDLHIPRIDEVLAWMREEKKMHIMIAIYSHYPQGTHDWGYELINLQTHTCKYFNYEYSSYEAAAISGIEYVIDNLI